MKNNNQIFGFAQKLGKALMTPIAVLPAAAILLRFGSSDLLNLPWMEAAGNAVFGNLAIIFAISIAVSFAKNGNGVAAIAAALSHYVIVTVATSFNSDINLGVVSGIIAGLLAAALYNRFYNIKLPELLGFFGGKRFVPIVTSLCSLVIGALMGFVWPPVQEGIKQLGMVAISAGPVGSFINGFINRLLLPFGLHHMLTIPMNYTSFGGTYTIATGINAGKQVFGQDPLWLAWVTDLINYKDAGNMEAYKTLLTTVTPARFKVGQMIGATGLLLGVALAMYRRVDVEQKDSGVTVEEEIDGWRDGEGGGAVKDAKRLDYIFCNTQKKVKSSKVVCNGKNYPVVSDHYGVMIEVED